MITSALTPGAHAITASVTDAGGAGGSAQVTLTINTAPVVAITGPAEASIASSRARSLIEPPPGDS